MGQFARDGNTLQLLWYTETYIYLVSDFVESTTLTSCHVDQLFLRENGEIMASIIYSTNTTFGKSLRVIRPRETTQKILQYKSDVNAGTGLRYCYVPSKRQLVFCSEAVSSVYVAILNARV